MAAQRSSTRTPLIHVTQPNVPDDPAVEIDLPHSITDEFNDGGIDNELFHLTRDNDVPTPLPTVTVKNSPVFVFEADCTSLYSRRGSSISSVTPTYNMLLSRRGSHGPSSSEKSSITLTVPTTTNYRGSDASWSGGNGLKLDSVSETQIPPPSPGLLSTNSAWSELVRLGPSRKSSDAGISDFSRSNSRSLSNVSSSLSEHLRYLVRAFSSRTEKVKETTLQPASPSSLSEYANSDALSAISTENPQVRHRLDSFFPDPPEGDTVSEIVRFQEEHSQSQKRWRIPGWVKKIRIPHVIEPQSKLYLFWLFIVTLAFMYNVWVIPLRATFPYQTPKNLKYWLLCDYMCDLIYILDIVFFKTRISYLNSGLKETSRRNTRQNYFNKRMFKFDVLSLLPLDLFYLVNMQVNPWLRLPRVLKIQTFWEFYSRCDHMVRSAHTVRILKTITYMLFLIHVETCGYYVVSVFEGIGTNEWVYDGVGNAYIRCFYLATKTATSIGNNPKPTNIMEYMFMTVYWVSGVFVFAFLIGQVRDIVDAANLVKTVYTQRMDAALQYVKNMNLPKETQDRVRTWFIYNWQQQKIIDERNLMNALPSKLRTDLAIHVHFNTLSKVKLFQDCDKTLLYDLVLKLKPILYLPGDYVCKKGEIGKEMYIVSQGIVEVVGGPNNSLVLATLREGSVFGEISLLAMAAEGNRRTADVRCRGFTNLFILSKAEFEAAMADYPDAHQLLKKRAKKLLRVNARLQKKSTGSMDQSKIRAEEIIRTPPETPKMVKTVLQMMDPESDLVRHLSTKRLNTSSDTVNDSAESEGREQHIRDNEAFVLESENNKNNRRLVETDLEIYDEILKPEPWDLMDKDIMETVTIETEPAITSPQKKTSNSSESSCDSGVQDTKNASPSSSTSRTISNKDSKESFMSTELVDILEDPEDPNSEHRIPDIPEDPGHLDTLSYEDKLDILEEIEREMVIREANRTSVPEGDTSGVIESGSSVSTSDSVQNKAGSGNQSALNQSASRQQGAEGVAKETKAPITKSSEKVVSNISKHGESPTKHSSSGSKGPGPKPSPLPKKRRDTGASAEKKHTTGNGRDHVKGGGGGSVKSPFLTSSLRVKTSSPRKLPESGKPKIPPKPDRKKVLKALGAKAKEDKQKTVSTICPTADDGKGTQLPSVDTVTEESKPDHSDKRQSSPSPEVRHIISIPIITMERPSDDDTTDNSSENFTLPEITVEQADDIAELECDQEMKVVSSDCQEATAGASGGDDAIVNQPIRAQSRIPPENRVTCMVEVHREKTMTPSPRLEQTSPRKRKISVVSIASEQKDDESSV